MSRLSGSSPCCLITGAADGIGRALALRYAAAGYTIVGIDRDEARAAQTTAELRAHGATVRFLLADLADPATPERLLPALAEAAPFAVVIHNAGISAVGPFARSDIARQQAVLDINLRAPLLLTGALLRAGLLARPASLVFVASLSHYTSYPGAAAYAASKDGLVSYARSLAASSRALHVLTVFPGPTRTAHARRYSPDNRREARRMPPARLAALIFAAQQRRQRTLVPGAGNRVLAWLGWLAPGLLERLMRRALFARLPQEPLQ